jgi:hypothetical protein
VQLGHCGGAQRRCCCDAEAADEQHNRELQLHLHTHVNVLLQILYFSHDINLLLLNDIMWHVFSISLL